MKQSILNEIKNSNKNFCKVLDMTKRRNALNKLPEWYYDLHEECRRFYQDGSPCLLHRVELGRRGIQGKYVDEAIQTDTQGLLKAVVRQALAIAEGLSEYPEETRDLFYDMMVRQGMKDLRDEDRFWLDFQGSLSKAIWDMQSCIRKRK